MVAKIHAFIRQDLILNQGDLLLLENYYSHKYRSRSRFLDINVGMFLRDDYKQVVQIYVADKHSKIREQLVIENNKIVDTDIIYKRYEE